MIFLKRHQPTDWLALLQWLSEQVRRRVTNLRQTIKNGSPLKLCSFIYSKQVVGCSTCVTTFYQQHD